MRPICIPFVSWFAVAGRLVVLRTGHWAGHHQISHEAVTKATDKRSAAALRAVVCHFIPRYVPRTFPLTACNTPSGRNASLTASIPGPTCAPRRPDTADLGPAKNWHRGWLVGGSWSCRLPAGASGVMRFHYVTGDIRSLNGDAVDDQFYWTLCLFVEYLLMTRTRSDRRNNLDNSVIATK